MNAAGSWTTLLLRLSMHHRAIVLGVWAAALAFALPGLVWLEIDTSTESVLDRSGDAWDFYQASLSEFGGDEVIVVALPVDLRDASAHRRIARLSAAFEDIPGVRRVDSLATVPWVDSRSDGTLSLEPYISASDHEGTNAGGLIERLSGDRVAPRFLVSDDFETVGINVFLEAGETGYESVVERIRESLGSQEAWISGVPVFRAETNLRTWDELKLFVPATLVALALVLLVSFRSALATVLTLTVPTAGAWVTCGLMGTLAVPLSLTTVILPSVLLALGCSYAMHVVAAAAIRQDEVLEHRLLPTVRPVLLSGTTTATGFGAMTLVRIEAIQMVGLFGALGALVMTAAALTLLPALLARIPLPRERGFARWLGSPAADRLRGINVRFPAVLLGFWASLIGLSVVGASFVRTETDVTQWFEPHTTVRKSYEQIGDRLSGISPMNVVIRSEDSGPVTEPRVLARIDALAGYLEAQPDVGRALSLADPIRQIHGGFSGDLRQPLPEDRAAIEQYLLLLESMDPIRDLVSSDRTQANLLLRLNDNGSAYLMETARRIGSWWDGNGAEGFSVTTTGVMFEFARAAEEISWGQVRGLGAALSAITLVLWLVFRSLALVGVILIPNVVPVLVAFGILGWLGVPLDAGTVLIANLALGIAVDDTLHLVEAFESAGRRIGPALERVLPAVTLTTVAVCVGFMVLALSQFTLVRNLGLVTAGVLLVCWAADVLLLPVLLRLTRS